MGLTFAIGFDETLVEDVGPLRFRAGAREGLLALFAAGHRLILHSSRSSPLDDDTSPLETRRQIAEWFESGRLPDPVTAQWDRFDEMRRFLQRENVWQLLTVWQQPGKPPADIYLDGRSEAPNWSQVIRDFSVKSERAS